MNIKSSPNSDFTLRIVGITITLFASFMLVSAMESVRSEKTYKIDNVRHVEELDDIDNIEDIDETYKLSEIELTDKQKQQIMEQKDVTTKNEIHEVASIYFSSQVAFTTDTGVYIADVGMIYQNLPWVGLTMTLVSLILFLYACAVYSMIDDDGIPPTLSVFGAVCSFVSFVGLLMVVFIIPNL